MSNGSVPSTRIAKSVREAVRYAFERGLVVNRTKLLKLLYFADLRAVDKGVIPRSDVQWVWYNYGPFSSAVLSAEDALVYSGALRRESVNSGTGDEWQKLVPDLEFIPNEETTSLDREFFAILYTVIDDYGSLSATEITQRSYQSPPMELAQSDSGERGGFLDTTLGEKRKLKTARDRLSRLDSLKSRREVFRRSSDEGDPRELSAELDCLTPARQRATESLIGRFGREGA